MLQDRTLGRQIEEFIRDNHANAEWAVREVASRLLEVYATIEDAYLRERGNDIEDVTHRLIKILSGTQTRDLSKLSNEAIIVAEDLLPSVAAELDPGKGARVRDELRRNNIAHGDHRSQSGYSRYSGIARNNFTCQVRRDHRY